MTNPLLTALAVLPLAALAQTVASASGTNVVYTSGVVTNRAWVRHVATATGRDFATLRDRTGTFASAADVAALRATTERLGEIEAAWSNGFARGHAELQSRLSQTPTDGVMLGLQFPPPPDASRRALEMYVVGTAYDGGYDYFLVNFSRPLSVKPNIEVPYVWNGGFTTNRVAGTWDFGASRWTNVVSLAQSGIAYTNVHTLRVERPAALAGVPCNLNPHVLFGRRGAGVTWGSIVLTVNGRPTYGGTLTNAADGTFMQIYNGAILAPGIQGGSQ